MINRFKNKSLWESIFACSIFACLLFAVKLWIISVYGNATPFWDQWNAEAANLYQPFIEGGLNWSDMLAAHNEHHILITRLLALGLLMVNGLWNPLLQMVVNAGLHVFTIVATVLLMTRVLGQKYLYPLLTFSLFLFAVPYAWENTLAGFQSQFYFVLLFSVLTLWFTITKEPFTRYWWCGLAFALLAFFSLASGVFALAASAMIAMIFYFLGLRKNTHQIVSILFFIALFIIGLKLTPVLAKHAFLKASSFKQFYEALMAVLAWPIDASFIAAIFRNSPSLILIGLMLKRRPPASDQRWWLVALAIWVFGQSFSIAYGRAVGNLGSRYLDLFSFGILINFACLIAVSQMYSGLFKKVNRAYKWLWVVSIMMCIGCIGAHLSDDLILKSSQSHTQELNVRQYVLTGDLKHLTNKPLMDLPYPHPDGLAAILSIPTIRGILPSNINVPIKADLTITRPLNGFVKNGYYPTTPSRDEEVLGSYGLHGDADVGSSVISFSQNDYSGYLAVPIAGYPLGKGVKLEFVQNGKVIPIVISHNPKESWGSAYIKVNKGNFDVKITDNSHAYWVAVGLPTRVGLLDRYVNWLLSSYYYFIGFAFGLLVMMVSFRKSPSHNDTSGI